MSRRSPLLSLRKPEYDDHQDPGYDALVAAMRDTVAPPKAWILLIVATVPSALLFLLLGGPDLAYIMNANHKPGTTDAAYLASLSTNIEIPDAGNRANTPDVVVAGDGELRLIGLNDQPIEVHISKIPSGASRTVVLPAGSRQTVNLPRGCHRLGWTAEGRGPQIIMQCLPQPNGTRHATINLANPAGGQK